MKNNSYEKGVTAGYSDEKLGHLPGKSPERPGTTGQEDQIHGSG